MDIGLRTIRSDGCGDLRGGYPSGVGRRDGILVVDGLEVVSGVVGEREGARERTG